ncbi:PEGA domain-containing protein [Longitalea luteola]|uniref:PEGA domain-containing protein n=1 Tax=Longitalea luteola TaxID=2812563 RepID=UPI001A95FDF4|nr:PEGA domain-containing protein [Longitalea luteola]
MLAGLITLSSSCATIVSKSSYMVTVDSTPRDAQVTVTNRNDEQVYSGRTPALVRLKSGAGFFRAAAYEIKISKEGFATQTVSIRASLNGWYIGNLLFGGLIGFLIVDPATGAMYRLKELDINETLHQETKTTAVTQTPQLHIYDINNIPESWKNKLVAIK